MKAILILDINDDSDLSSEADVIIDNGDFHLETKEFLKPLQVIDKFDEDDMECKKCIHYYWCDTCLDYHCENFDYLGGDGICRYAPTVYGEEENNVRNGNEDKSTI